MDLHKSLKRSDAIQQVAKPRIAINFNRRILDHATIQAIKDTLAAQGSVRGDAIEGVLDDLMKLRYLCGEIVEKYMENDKEGALRGLEMLRLVL